VTYYVKPNTCNCHPETCCCNAWKVVDAQGERHSTHQMKSVAESAALLLNRSEAKPTLVGTVLAIAKEADKYDPDRTIDGILAHGVSEMAETMDEVNIVMGRSPGVSPGVDGVIGESIDTILCMLDLIYKTDPAITEADIVAIAEMKGAKWLRQIKAKADAHKGLETTEQWIPDDDRC
jgi:hypothetical protein